MSDDNNVDTLVSLAGEVQVQIGYILYFYGRSERLESASCSSSKRERGGRLSRLLGPEYVLKLVAQGLRFPLPHHPTKTITVLMMVLRLYGLPLIKRGRGRNLERYVRIE